MHAREVERGKMYSLFPFSFPSFFPTPSPFLFLCHLLPVTHSRLLRSLVTPPCRFYPFHLSEVIRERDASKVHTTSSLGVNGRATRSAVFFLW